MSTKQFKEFISSVFSPVSHLGRKFRRFLKRISKAVRRELLLITRRAKRSGAGFVLPTVTMVMLVVVLLTLSIAFRSFERVNQARNVRVNQALLSASTPALDRARAKLQKLLEDQTKTPADGRLLQDLTEVKIVSGISSYTYKLPDEDVVKVSFDMDGGGIKPEGADNDIGSVNDNESFATAWRFPMDTDNDGKYDTYNLYGVFFRNPTTARERKPLDARTPPFATTTSTNATCQSLANSILVGGSGWYLSDARLKKSFFVYTVNVPITDVTGLGANYEKFTGNTGTTALEFQQDWTRTLPTTNAVVYEDDLVITNSGTFNLNGRIVAKSNFMIAPQTDAGFVSYLISGKNSCYFNAENSKIFVGGNVIAGRFHNDIQTTSNVHLYPDANSESVSSTNQSLTSITGTNARNLGFSNQAYNQRIASLKSVFPTTYPTEVQNAIDQENKPVDVAIENYLRDRTRKVPFAEANNTAISSTGTLVGSGDSLRPQDDWTIPVTGTALTNITGVTINAAQLATTQPDKVEKDQEYKLGDRIQVGNNLPFKFWSNTDNKFLSGKNIFQTVGSKWENPTPTTNNGDKLRYSQIQSSVDVGATDRDGFWELMAGTMTQQPSDGMGGLRLVTGAGIYDRTNSFLPPPYWDDPRTPTTPTDPPVIEAKTTYDDPTTTNVEQYPIVWPDTMPMSPGPVGTKIYNNSTKTWDVLTATSNLKGDLQMRATAVYHYAIEPIKDESGNILVDNGSDDLLRGYQKPVACISSYYDPTDKTTSRNPSGASPTLADVSGEIVGSQPAGGRSNNGIVYGPPSTSAPTTGVTPNNTTGLFSGTDALYQQANLVFPNGRFVNELLRKALMKDAEDRTLAEKSAIDAELCSLGILGVSGYTLGSKPSYIPDGAIREVSFLDARQIKAVDADNTSTTIDETASLNTTNALIDGTYKQPIEERQPLEIRATEIDLDKLRKAQVATSVTFTSGGATLTGPAPEYLLPNSGIIFASRNDAIADRSNKNSNEYSSKSLSTSDFLLDPTRRPNGVVLVNGEKLSRNDSQNGNVNTEKGLIMVSDLPVYVKGDFNKHTQEEFTETLTASTWANFYTRTGINNQFACRPSDPRLPNCTTGDTWRAATVLTDALTLLSKDFRYGVRNEGDFDLINNALGTVAIPDLVNQTSSTSAKISLRENGFHNNYFGVNGLSSGTSVFATDITDDDYSNLDTTSNQAINSSYFNNFITPIQRRANFSEYLMETCFKLPASSCTLNDWVVEYNGTNKFARTLVNDSTFDITKLNTGTTAIPPKAEYQRFPRRIAAYRNRSHRLELTNDNTIQLLGIDSNAKVKAYPYKVSSATQAVADRSADIPRLVNNALVYWTTRTINKSKQGRPYKDPTLISLEVKQPLYWYPSGEDTTLLNPPLPDLGDYSFPDTIHKYTFCSNSNGASTNYSISKDPKASNTDTGNNADTDGNFNSCDGLTGQIFNGIDDNSDIDRSYADTTHNSKSVPAWDGNSDLVIDANLSTATTDDDLTDKDGNGVLAYKIPNYIFNTATGKKTITIYGNKDQVIVLKPFATQQDDKFIVLGNQEANHIEMFFEGGIEPNNVIWLADGKMPSSLSDSNPAPSLKVFNPTVGETHLLGGNFVGSGGEKLELGGNTEIMGRVIGFNGSEQTFDQDFCAAPGPFGPEKREWLMAQGNSGNNNSGGNSGNNNGGGNNPSPSPTTSPSTSPSPSPTTSPSPSPSPGGGSNKPVKDFGTGCLPEGTRIIGVSTPKQPLFVPLLNIYVPGKLDNLASVNAVKTLPTNSTNTYNGATTKWLPKASANHEYDLILGSYDTPTRPGETNGSLENLPRFIESWTGKTVKILGGFYQLGRSKFADAPFTQLLTDVNALQASVTDNAGFDYATAFSRTAITNRYNLFSNTTSAANTFPYYTAPTREWGYDVGLLSQIPDLFAQRLSTPNPDPNEYFREVGRDDPWVKALLCGKVDNTLTPNTYGGTNAVSGEYRPSDCSKYTGS